ncbi:MAG: tRNA lysidine(34) synthetase TilS, partial [Clostridia bacterium]|nr:tRNA lysidine(34) synthetase TilS [Clostridia bacterium]
MIDKVGAFITDNNLIPQGSRVIAALSGGSDSMALFNILLALKDELGFALEAAHVNHGIRGKEADSDEAFVRDYCDKKGIKCHVLSADVKKKAADEKLSEEEAGRQVRYDFFASFGSDVLISTAHNLDDRV